ncbi:DUF2142 domain-containing protein [Enterococcus sp. LJL99]
MIKENVKELNKNRILIFCSLIFLVFGQFLLQYKEVRWPKLYIILAVVFFVLVFTFSRLNNQNKIHRNAFVLILTVGTLNTFILPVRQNLDENTHYYHALELADGKIINQTNEMNFLDISPDFLAETKMPSKPGYGNDLNTNLYYKEFFEIEHKPSEYKEELLNKSGFNNPAYIPSALGISFGRLISNKIAVSYYLGRIFNVLFYALLVLLAIKLSKNYKLQIFLASAVPYALWVSVGYTYDNLYYGLVILIIAQITNFLGPKNKVTTRDIILYELTCLGLVFCKAPTILLAFLPLFIPKEKYDSGLMLLKNLFITGFFLFLGLIWLIQAKIFEIFRASSPILEKASDGNGESSNIIYFLRHPIYSVELVLRSLSDVLSTIVGSIQRPQPYLLRSDTLAAINGIVFIVLLILVTLLVKIRLNKTFLIASLSIFLLIILGTILAISGDPRVFNIGDLHVDGVQGRYHFYILVFLPLLLAPYIQKPSFAIADFASSIDEDRLIVFVTKMIYMVTILNTAVALYGYL